MATKNAVANYFLSKVNYRVDGGISHLKLQRLMYYAQAWHVSLTYIAERDIVSIFDDHEEFLAYAHGPTLLSIWKKYRRNGYQAIKEVDTTEIGTISVFEKDVLEFVWDNYGNLTAKQLEKQSCSEEPWIEARGDLPEGYSSNAIISIESMCKFYREKIVELK